MDGMPLFRSNTRLLHLYPKAHSFHQLSPLTWVITYSTCICPTLGHSHQELISYNNSHLKPLPDLICPFSYCPISLVPCQGKTNKNLKNSLSSLSPVLSFHSPLNSFQLGFHPFHSTVTVLSGSPITSKAKWTVISQALTCSIWHGCSLLGLHWLLALFLYHWLLLLSLLTDSSFIWLQTLETLRPVVISINTHCSSDFV